MKWILRYLHGTSDLRICLEKCVALSPIETEFIAITKACKELLWLKKLLQELDFVQDKVQFILICDAFDAKLLELTKVHIDDNGVDIMTKAVMRGKFEACCEITRLAITST
ncbi:hypothetical protein CR513_04515, partial [Mucuna pruriens]